jgi:hypothetical protein
MTDTVQDGTLRTRRSLLTAAAGGAAALAVSAIKPAGVAAAPANMQTESDNPTTNDATGVTNSTDGVTALYGSAAGNGTGVEGTSETGKGLRGHSMDTSDPQNNTDNAGVVGVAGDVGAIASSIALTGVYGYADTTPDSNFAVGSGVWGDSPDIGVFGGGSIGVIGDGGFGVLGSTSVTDGAGVFAESTVGDAVALAVDGRAVFSRSGRATVNGGSKKEVVNLAGCTSNTLVIAVLAQNRDGRYVRAAVPESGKFTIYLNANVGSNTKVSWIAFTNPANFLG